MKLKLTKAEMETEPSITKKQRTKTFRRLRHKISPILISSPSNSFSSDSSKVTVESNAKNKRKLIDVEKDDLPFRRITRSYYKQQNQKKLLNESLVEVSESSCVESTSEAVFAKQADNDVISTASNASKNNNNNSSLLPVEETDQLSEITKNDVAASVDVSSSVVEQQQNSKSLGLFEADLACAEHLAYDDVISDYSCYSHDSEFQFEVFQESTSSDGLEFSSEEYTPSIFFDSGGEFSEKSSDDAPPSRTYSLLLEFRRQFLRSSVSLDTLRPSLTKAESCLGFVKFKDEDEEESYQRLRERERRQLFLLDYVDMYGSTTEYGELIFQRRLQMVHWIVEQSTAKGYQQETMFLGISLMDRFLSKGFFNNTRNLQTVGIACLTLATRIEENQPYNCVSQKNFRIVNNLYSKSEVVAMEWLVQEVLSFQCFLPTIQNFMWFYLKAARADAEVEKKARYLARLALSDHEHLRHWPSTVAAGLVILASLQSDQIESYKQVIEVHIRTKENDLHECIKTMEWLIQYVN